MNLDMNGPVKLSTAMSRNYSADQKAKEYQMELLMEKLRSRTSQYKTLADTSKAVRMTMLDKRWALDSADKAVLQKCLDSLQHSIKVTSLQSLIERLECLSRQLGLKFMVGTSGVDLFISSDMFYLEILLEATGAVKDVKIHHEGKVEQQSCEELVRCISRGDFADFVLQLEGLASAYRLNAEKKIKCKAFGALQSLEADLLTLSQLQQGSAKEPWALVHKGPLGFLLKRRGGHAMRLTYFVSPYELLDKEKGLQPLTTELLSASSSNGQQKEPIGHYATVILEGSTANKLQIAPIITITQRPMGKSGPAYGALSASNSWALPARFALRLPRPMAVSAAAQRRMQPGQEPCEEPPLRPLLGLLARQALQRDPHLSRGLFVTLPDQAQCYFLTESKNLTGSMISSVPFTHPSHVPTIISCLRQQALFNTLIASCIRPNSKQDLESMIMFEVSALSWQHISVSLEHPIEESMATVEMDLSDVSLPRVAIYTSGSGNAGLEPLNEYISRVLQKSHSIPITLRSLLKFWEREANVKHANGGYSALDNSNFSLGLGGLDPGGPDIKRENGGPGQTAANRTMYPSNVNHPHQGAGSGAYRSTSAPRDGERSAEASPGRERRKRRVRERRRRRDRPDKRARLAAPDDASSGESSPPSEEEAEEASEEEWASEGGAEEASRSPASASEPDGERSADEAGGEADAAAPPDGRSPSPDDLRDPQDARDARDAIRNSVFKSDHRKKHKSRDSPESRSKTSTTASLLLDLTDSKYKPSSISITPIESGNLTPSTPSASTTPPNFSSMLCLDRRPGIEIIPISSTPPSTLPSSITITPIAKPIDERHRSEKKSSSSKSSRSAGSERSKDKKKKKRREDPMGPPDKLPPKQDPLTKPVSVSIKPAEGSPLASRSASPNSLIRKFSPSPTHGRSVSITKSPSPSNLKSSGKPSVHHSSPRSSPIQSSPKHLSGYSSPKSIGTSSPKHGSSGSGKPSMSALKSVTSGSPSSKSSSSYELAKFSNKTTSSKDGYVSSNRDKDRKTPQGGMSFSNSGSCSPKLKSSSVKLKQLDLSPSPTAEMLLPIACDNIIGSSQGTDINKSTANQARNRKGSLSAVIDKLKSAQYCGNESELAATKTSSNNNLNKERPANFNKVNDSRNSSNLKLSDTKNQEYMVKPSSDGMKITINKTRTKDSNSGISKTITNSGIKQSSPLSNANAASLKTHTGLKPGVISGPASKKPQVILSSKSGGSNLSPQSGGAVKTSVGLISNANSPKMNYAKSNSSSSIGVLGGNKSASSKIGTGSPKTSSSSDPSKITREREKSRIKSGDKSIFSSKSGERRSSPAPNRDEPDGDRSLKILNQHPKESNFSVEGMMKSLDTSKFQIPKLSARNAVDDPSKKPASQQPNDAPKPLDFVANSKYAFQQINAKWGDTGAEPPTLDGAVMASLDSRDFQKENSRVEVARPDGIAAAKAYPAISVCSAETINRNLARRLEAAGKGPVAPAKGAELARPVLPPPAPSAASGEAEAPSPSVSVRIVESPAPSPLSRSPRITDDELMDEALVASGK